MSNPSQVRNAFHQFEVGFEIIADLITPGTRVLDLGCGSGSLLEILRDKKDVEGCGVELDQEKVIRCVERGIRVMSIDLDQGLVGFPDLSYEYVVLSRTLQQLTNPERVVREMLRVGSKSIIAFPNYGHWRVALEHVISGRTPTSHTYPDPWYNSPDIHRITINDFKDFVRTIGGRIEKEIYIKNNVPCSNLFLPNIRADWGCFQISTK